mmetsp:Transcript_73864/g.204670  ORF Transcript_73864/g.204670 Transcript_73864/m.204670 type:complete len:120 (-) Transcript_73864:140-499(-)
MSGVCSLARRRHEASLCAGAALLWSRGEARPLLVERVASSWVGNIPAGRRRVPRSRAEGDATCTERHATRVVDLGERHVLPAARQLHVHPLRKERLHIRLRHGVQRKDGPLHGSAGLVF